MYQDLISIHGYNQGKDSELEGYTPAIGQPRRMVLLYILLPTIPPPPQVCVEVATPFFLFFLSGPFVGISLPPLTPNHFSVLGNFLDILLQGKGLGGSGQSLGYP